MTYELMLSAILPGLDIFFKHTTYLSYNLCSLFLLWFFIVITIFFCRVSGFN